MQVSYESQPEPFTAGKQEPGQSRASLAAVFLLTRASSPA